MEAQKRLDFNLLSDRAIAKYKRLHRLHTTHTSLPYFDPFRKPALIRSSTNRDTPPITSPLTPSSTTSSNSSSIYDTHPPLIDGHLPWIKDEAQKLEIEQLNHHFRATTDKPRNEFDFETESIAYFIYAVKNQDKSLKLPMEQVQFDSSL